MLSKFRVQHYKSLFDVTVDLEPLTVFIGPNGSGKSNICEALVVSSDFLKRLIDIDGSSRDEYLIVPFFAKSFQTIDKSQQSIESKFWRGKADYFNFEFYTSDGLPDQSKNKADLSVHIDHSEKMVHLKTFDQEDMEIRTAFMKESQSDQLSLLFLKQQLLASVENVLRKVEIYDFDPLEISRNIQLTISIDRKGLGIAHSLVDILHTNRKGFDELESRFTQLVPNIKEIVLPRRDDRSFSLELVDRYSDHHIPASDISDGTLRILAFLTALYQENTPSIICFEEPENGVHPWLLHKMMELLKIISTEGITGNPVQILITTHSPVLLNYVEPHQVRAVELDHEGKTQVHALPVDSVRFQKALEAYDGALGELWFTNVFGGNPA